MSYKLYEKRSGGLIHQAGDVVNIFPSGLIRVNQTYICNKWSADSHRYNRLGEGKKISPGEITNVDGLYIYPQPSERDLGNGFIEFSVSAYGRVNKIGRVSTEWRIWEKNGTFKPEIGDEYQVTAIMKNRVKTVSKVITTEESMGYIPDNGFSLIDEPNGATLPVMIYGQLPNTENTKYALVVKNYTSVNYGYFTEIKYNIDFAEISEIKTT